MSVPTINDLTKPHYKEFRKISKNFNQLEQELSLKSMKTGLLELELDRRRNACIDMIQNVYDVLREAESQNMLTYLDDLEAVCKSLRSITTKGQPLPITPAQASDTERNGVKLILAQGEGASQ